MSAGGGEFAAAVRRSVPRGFGFRGFPVQFNHVSPARMMSTLLASPTALDILRVSGLDPSREPCHCQWKSTSLADAASSHSCLQMIGDKEDTSFALRCKVFVYAEDTVAVWVMLAVRHRFADSALPPKR